MAKARIGHNWSRWSSGQGEHFENKSVEGDRCEQGGIYHPECHGRELPITPAASPTTNRSAPFIRSGTANPGAGTTKQALLQLIYSSVV
ncbi:hypothetical protein RRG08_000499 [Elysia crispata]|uniref:Uncharacterized protein n=1 Tax=Elysia crispata TaxID=231223 RepID=A0AAE1CWV5_9GAST|nr:hypothetical protein RRG08_000499 [Elysia crispata]